ncbi:MAG: hypothetical protein ACK5O5_01055, partial [bacterium]
PCRSRRSTGSKGIEAFGVAGCSGIWPTSSILRFPQFLRQSWPTRSLSRTIPTDLCHPRGDFQPFLGRERKISESLASTEHLTSIWRSQIYFPG